MAKVEFAVTEDGVHVAYRVLDADSSCSDPRDLVLVAGGLIPLEIYEEEPGFLRLLDGLRGLGRVVVFDRRGVGLSDPVPDWERPILDQWADDLATVVAATSVHNAIVVSVEGYGVGSRFVAQHPEHVSRFVVYEPILMPDEQWEEFRADRLGAIEKNMTGEIDLLYLMAPSRAADPSFREWYERAGRAGASPASARRIWESVMTSRPSEQLLDRVTVPTLVLHRRESKIAVDGVLEYVGSLIPGATLVEVEGRDAFAFAGDVDSLVAEIGHFLLGERRLPPPQRLLSGVLFTDLVGSTERAVSLGDADWKALLDRHDAAVRTAVGRSGGSVVKTTGDGVLALLPSAAGCLRAAHAVIRDLAAEGLDVRIGVHVGDIDRRGDDVSGLAVNVAARVMSKAGTGEIVVTAMVVGAVAGQAVAFEPLGAHDLKGVPGPWELFRVVEGAALS